MIKNLREKLVIKLGGSLMSTKENTIDIEFIDRFASYIRLLSKRVGAIFIVVGGGQIVRDYQSAARELGVKIGDDLDTIGMRLTRVNAELLRSAIGREIAGEIIFTGGDFRWHSKVVIGAGWGHAVTSDYNAVKATEMIGTSELVRLSNIDHIYTDNPNKNPEAKPIIDLDWDELDEINVTEGNDKFRPGMNVPLDPRALSLARRLRLKMAFIGGHELVEINRYLEGESFFGTFVHP